MQRFNQKGGPDFSTMTECEKGFWVKHSDALAVERHLSNRFKAAHEASECYEAYGAGLEGEIAVLNRRIKGLEIVIVCFVAAFLGSLVAVLAQ